MPNLSQIELSGITYDLKDKVARQEPIDSRTYTDVIGTANDNNGAGFFYMKVRATTFDTKWHVKVKVHATVPGNINYNTDSTFDIWGRQNTYDAYMCFNDIFSTSYRPIYYNCVFFTNSTGYTNNCGNWLGFNLYASTNPTSTSYKRTVVVELIQYDGCDVEFVDTLYTPTNIPERAAHTGWYSSTNTSYTNFNACDQGLKQTGDSNTTSISNLYVYSGAYVADSKVCRYELLFQKDENTLTPLNNVENGYNSTTKTMLTTVEFNPFGRIFYWNTTTNVNAAANLGAGSLFYGLNGLDLRYTFNCGMTLTAHKPFYLVVTPTSGGKCKIASSSPWAITLPSTADGNWYILLGRTYSTYQMALYPYHPVYEYRNGAIREVTPSKYIYTDANSDGNIVIS